MVVVLGHKLKEFLKNELCNGRRKNSGSLLDLKAAVDQLEQLDSPVASDIYASLLRECGNCKALAEAKRVHARVCKDGYDRGTFLGNLAVQMYASCGSLQDARSAFERIHERNAVSGNIMITAYAQHGHLQEAKNIFDQMPEQTDVSWNAMVGAYAQNRHLLEARDMFARMPHRDAIAWNIMLAAYAEDGQGKEALQLFRRMDLDGGQPSKITLITILDAFDSPSALLEYKAILDSIEDSGFESDVRLGTAIVNMYGRCGSVHSARGSFDKMPEKNVVSWNAIVAAYAQNGYLHEAAELFAEMPERDVVSWNTMISAYAQNGHGKEALRHFRIMDLQGMQASRVTFLNVLDACDSAAALAEGRLVHAEIVMGGFIADAVVQTAIVNMYGKCGSPGDAKNLFEKMSKRDVVAWNAMIAANAQNGHPLQAFELFREMVQEGVQLSRVTMVAILSACTHVGQLNAGWKWFISIPADYGIAPAMDHYVCMVNLLGRAGQLSEAEELIKNMPFVPSAVAWTILQDASRLHGDMKRGSGAAGNVLQLDPGTASSYVMLSNMHARSDTDFAVLDDDMGILLRAT